MDSCERGASDLSPAPGPGLLTATSGLLSGGHGDASPFLAARGGVHRPEEPQVRHEAAVGDLGVRAGLQATSHPIIVPRLWLSYKESDLFHRDHRCSDIKLISSTIVMD